MVATSSSIAKPWMRRLLRGWVRWALLALVLLVYGFSGGCLASSLPPRPSQDDLKLLAAAPLPYRIVVVPWEPGSHGSQSSEAYTNGTFRWLRDSHAFASV